MTLIRSLAVVGGIVALTAPLLVLYRAARRRMPDESVGTDTSVKAGGALATTVVLMLTGFVLWRELPLGLLARAELALSLLGGLFYFPAIGLYLWGLRTMGQIFWVSSACSAALPPDHAIVEEGPYRLVRHPMYLGVILAAAGALLIFRTWAMVVFFPLSFVVVARARQEEAALLRRHGAGWVSYAHRVPPWIPRIR